MTDSWLDDWGGRIRTLGEGLLNLEINTVEKASMSAQKMPDVPLALHAIIDAYVLYLTRQGYAPDENLLQLATACIQLKPDTPAADEKRHEDALAAWHPSAASPPTSDLTNGPQTFEALQWAAWAAIRDTKFLCDEAALPRGTTVFDPETAGVLGRIRANSRQLREAAILLAKDHTTDEPRLPLFDVTLDATVRALLNNPLPPLFVRPDVLVLIRKAWDVGTEVVLLQTAVQIDGDVLMRISPQLDQTKREFFLALHDRCTQTGLGQWRNLFDLLRALAQDMGKAVWGLAH